eukprot:jgi/Chlat1/198/Chrsp1S03034
MTRKCSYCGHHGHNSRTCPDRGVRLFGVRLTAAGAAGGADTGMRKSASMHNLSNHHVGGGGGGVGVVGGSASGLGAAAGGIERGDSTPKGDSAQEGYLSDSMVHTESATSVKERKKGVPWTEEEHRLFLVGLQKLGKGDWRGISRHVVQTRTPTQVASHAQKYFIRQNNLNKRKRRSSLFDIVNDLAPAASTSTASAAETKPVPVPSPPQSAPSVSSTPAHSYPPATFLHPFFDLSAQQHYALDPHRPHAYPVGVPLGIPPAGVPVFAVPGQQAALQLHMPVATGQPQVAADASKSDAASAPSHSQTPPTDALASDSQQPAATTSLGVPAASINGSGMATAAQQLPAGGAYPMLPDGRYLVLPWPSLHFPYGAAPSSSAPAEGSSKICRPQPSRPATVGKPPSEGLLSSSSDDGSSGMRPSQLTLKLFEGTQRPSAFHVQEAVDNASISVV